MTQEPERNSTGAAGGFSTPVSSEPQLGAKRRLHAAVRAMLFVIVGFLLIVLVNAMVNLLTPGRSLGVRSAIGYPFMIAVLLLESWILTRALDGRSFRTVGIWFFPGWAREFLMGIGLGMALMTLAVVVMAATGAVAFRGWNTPHGRAPLVFTETAGWLLLAATFEEVAFRGYGFQRLVDAVGPWLGALVFAGLFGVAHITNPSASPLSMANTVLAGLLLSLAYLKTRALWLPIGLHWAWNFSMGMIFSLPVSGLRLECGLLYAETTGPNWLSGGDYGPEASVVLMIVSTATIIWLSRTSLLRPSPAMKEVLE